MWLTCVVVPFIVPCLHSPKMADVSYVGCEKENLEKTAKRGKRCFIILYAQRYNFHFSFFILHSLFMYVIQSCTLYNISYNIYNKYYFICVRVCKRARVHVYTRARARTQTGTKKGTYFCRCL